MKLFPLTAAALILAAGSATASPLTDSLVAAWQAQGYQRIEIETGPTQVKVEAIRGTQKAEVVYDAATGAILRQEFERVDGDDNTRPGVFYERDDDDFTRDDDRWDDDRRDDDRWDDDRRDDDRRDGDRRDDDRWDDDRWDDDRRDDDRWDDDRWDDDRRDDDRDDRDDRRDRDDDDDDRRRHGGDDD